MKILVTSLDEDTKKWFKGFPNNHLQSYEDFAKLFKGRWKIKKDSGMNSTKLKRKRMKQ
jgi:hypothetical protein